MPASSNGERWSWVLLIVIAGALGSSMFGPFLLYGHSSDIDANRLLVFDAAIRSGDLFPRWVPHYYYGYGSPIFHFYGPLPYYIAEAFLLVGADTARALQCTLFATWLAAGLAMFLLARDYLSRPASLAAGVLYLLAPYHLVDMVVRHALGEHVAFIWIPLAIWGCAGGIARPGVIRFVVGALAVAALPFTHNITAMIALPVICGWCAFEAWRARSFRSLTIAAACVTTGLALSAFFWLPAFVEKDLVYAKESLTEEFFQYRHHFVFGRQLFIPSWDFGGSRAGIADDRMSFQIGLAHWSLIVLAVATLWRSRREWLADRDRVEWGALAAAAVFVGACVMTTPLSRPLWNAVSLLAFVQFPWRFLTLAAFGASLLAAFAIDGVSRGDPRRTWIVSLVVMATCLAVYGSYSTPRVAMWSVSAGYSVPIDFADLAGIDDAEYRDIRERLTLANIVSSGDNGTSRDDYLPRTVGERPTEPASAIAWILETGEEPTGGRAGPNRYVFELREAQSAHLIFNQFFFPGWVVRLDGHVVPSLIDNHHGAIIADVPVGEHKLEFAYESTPLRTGADIISLAALAALVGVAITGRIVSRRRLSSPANLN